MTNGKYVTFFVSNLDDKAKRNGVHSAGLKVYRRFHRKSVALRAVDMGDWRFSHNNSGIFLEYRAVDTGGGISGNTTPQQFV